MPEPTTTPDVEEEPDVHNLKNPPDGAPDTGETDWQAEAERWKTHAQKHEKEWKRFSKELDEARQASMTEQEKAVDQARAEGRAEATKESASKLVKAEIRASASGRFDKSALDELLDVVNTNVFITDDGEVDAAKVAKWINGIAPKPDETTGPAWPDLAQGARGAASTGSADPLLETVKRLAGSG